MTKKETNENFDKFIDALRRGVGFDFLKQIKRQALKENPHFGRKNKWVKNK